MILFSHFLAWFIGGLAAIRFFVLLNSDLPLFLVQSAMSRCAFVAIICTAWIICV